MKLLASVVSEIAFLDDIQHTTIEWQYHIYLPTKPVLCRQIRAWNKNSAAWRMSIEWVILFMDNDGKKAFINGITDENS